MKQRRLSGQLLFFLIATLGTATGLVAYGIISGQLPYALIGAGLALGSLGMYLSPAQLMVPVGEYLEGSPPRSTVSRTLEAVGTVVILVGLAWRWLQ